MSRSALDEESGEGSQFTKRNSTYNTKHVLKRAFCIYGKLDILVVTLGQSYIVGVAELGLES